MSKYAQGILPAILILALAAITCNVPASVKAPVLSSDEIVKTAAAEVLTAQAIAPPAIEAAELASPTAAQCSASVTATTNANVRSGPNTRFGAVGTLPQGGTAPVAGRNNDSTWWYIQFGGSYAWVSASVVTPTCIPVTVLVVAGPPLPAEPPPEPTEKPSLGPLLIQPYLQFEIVPSATSIFHKMEPFQVHP